jgi:uncharacterized protein (DUF433 family)
MNLLSSGIYSIPQAAKLLDVSRQTLRFWVSGRRNMRSEPIIKSELEPIEHLIAITFVNLMEVRFINAFSKYGVSVRSIRHMAEEARRVLRHPHPFATETMFRTDGRKIFIETVEKTRDPKLYDLKGKNWGLYQILSDALKKDVIYGPSGVAKEWYPRKDTAPSILINPKVAFGQPALEESGVPAEAFYEAYRAEGEDFDSVARWFDVPLKQVKEAVSFYVELQAIH